MLFPLTPNAATYEQGKQAYIDKDYARAVKILKPLAEAGDSQAQITLGLMYDYGHGVEKDAAESIKWYRMAAEQGVPLAQHDVGIRYFQGQGTKQNYLEAAKWWELSANAGITDSQFNLGLMYYRGIGIARDYPKAAELFEQAAKQDHGNAQYSLAVMYALGQSKAKDYNKALNWFRKSAEQNVAQAQFNIGVFYENGYGVERDHGAAKQWYQLAADQGLQEAAEKLRSLPTRPEPVVAENTAPVIAATAPETNAAAITMPTTTENKLDLSDWLRQQAPGHYTLQLTSVVNKNNVIKFINESNFGARAGYVEVIIDGITRYNAVYGLYNTRQHAERAIGELPGAIQKAKPWVRNIGALQRILR